VSSLHALSTTQTGPRRHPAFLRIGLAAGYGAWMVFRIRED
jgi:hypothetical protein